MGRRLVATTVRHMGYAHEKHSDERSCHGRFTQGPEAQLARANSPAVPSLLRSFLIPSGERRGVMTRVARWPSCRTLASQGI
jgi:hypothetical protein